MSFASISLSSFRHILYAKNACFCCPMLYQLRFKKGKNLRRKPVWLPMSPAKVFVIPQHPYRPPEERELVIDLLDEYYRKFVSLRAVFKEELENKSSLVTPQVQQDRDTEEDFQLLLEENHKENERIKIIREETFKKQFEEKTLQLMKNVEEKKIKDQKRKEDIDDIVRSVKESRHFFLSYENLEAAIEKAIDNPISYDFALTVNGDILWEGTPSTDFERRVMENVPQTQNS